MNLAQAAEYLGVARRTLYKWKEKARRNQGYLIFHGRAVRFRYRQTGAAGQGRILFERQWLDELKQAMECRQPVQPRTTRPALSHISVSLGIPPR